MSYDMDFENKQKLNECIFANRFLFKHLIGSKVLKYRLEGFLFYIFPRYTIQVYQLVQKLNHH